MSYRPHNNRKCTKGRNYKFMSHYNATTQETKTIRVELEIKEQQRMNKSDFNKLLSKN